MKTRWIIGCLLAALAVQGAWAQTENAPSPYTYTKDGDSHFYVMDDLWEINPQNEILASVGIEKTAQSPACMLNITLFEAKEGSAVVQLANKAYQDGGKLHLLTNLTGSITLSDGEILTSSGMGCWDKRIDAMAGSTEVGGIEVKILLTTLRSSRTDLSKVSLAQRHAYLVERLGKANITSLTIDSHRFTFVSMPTAPTLKSMFAAMSQKTGNEEWFTYRSAR